MNQEPLTKREIEVSSGVVMGYTAKEIGTKLFISPETVRTHLKKVYKKTNSRKQSDLTRWFFQKYLNINFTDMKAKNPDIEIPFKLWLKQGLTAIAIAALLIVGIINRHALPELSTSIIMQNKTAGFVLNKGQVNYTTTIATDLTFDELRENLRAECSQVTELGKELTATVPAIKLKEYSGFIQVWDDNQVKAHIHLFYHDSTNVEVTIQNIIVFDPDKRYQFGGMNYELNYIAIDRTKGKISREFKNTGAKVLEKAFADLIEDIQIK